MSSPPLVPLGLGLPEDDVRPGDHVAYFWESENEFKNAAKFLEIGLRGLDHCVIFGYEEANQRIVGTLQQHGFAVAQLRKENRLSILTADRTGDLTLENIGRTFQMALAAGAPLVRLLGNIGWNRPKWPDELDLLAFEAKVTTACKQFPCVVMCMYDVQAISGEVLIKGGLETHPVTIRGNIMRVNPYCLTR